VSQEIDSAFNQFFVRAISCGRFLHGPDEQKEQRQIVRVSSAESQVPNGEMPEPILHLFRHATIVVAPPENVARTAVLLDFYEVI